MNKTYQFFYKVTPNEIIIGLILFILISFLIMYYFNKKNEPSLIKAVKSKKLHLVKDELEKNSNINITNKYGFSAIYYANKEILDYLIKKGADININNFDNGTLLMNACGRFDYNIVELLTKNGAELNKKNEDGETALIIMLSNYHVIGGRKNGLKINDILNLLIKSGADINIKSDDDNTALDCAFNQTHIDILKNAGAK